MDTTPLSLSGAVGGHQERISPLRLSSLAGADRGVVSVLVVSVKEILDVYVGKFLFAGWILWRVVDEHSVCGFSG